MLRPDTGMLDKQVCLNHIQVYLIGKYG